MAWPGLRSAHMFHVFSVVTPGIQPPGFRSTMTSLSPVSMSKTCAPPQPSAQRYSKPQRCNSYLRHSTQFHHMHYEQMIPCMVTMQLMSCDQL